MLPVPEAAILPVILFINFQQYGDTSHASSTGHVGRPQAAEEGQMREIAVKRSESEGTSDLVLEFVNLDQLLESSDPRPLPGRELTELAEETIAGYVDEFPLKWPIGLTVALAQDSVAADVLALIPATVRRHFTFRLNDLDHEKRVSLSEGKISITIAAFNATVAILFVLFMNPYFENPVVFLLGGLVTILNWVTVWHTYEYFVYEYRQLRRKQKIYRKIAGMEIRA